MSIATIADKSTTTINDGFGAYNDTVTALLLEHTSAGAHRTKYTIEHHTANDTLTTSETGTIHTNLGEDGAMTLTLPQDAVAGHYFLFVVMTAQELRVDPGAAGAIYINGAKQTDNMYITANDEGESVMLVCDGNSDWIALFTQGTWGVET